MLRIQTNLSDAEPAEEALDRLNRELRAVSRCHQILLRAVDERALFEDVCRVICEEAGYRMVWVGLADAEGRTVRPIAWAGHVDGYLDVVTTIWAGARRRSGPAAALAAGETVSVQDYAVENPKVYWRHEALRRGYRSGIGLPLKSKAGEIFGTLNIYSVEPGAFTPEEVRLLEELAADLAFGVAVLRARAERYQIGRRLQANLRFFESMDRINHAIQETDDLEEMMSGVLEATLSIFGCDRAGLVHPCDPNAPAWRVAMERVRPEFQGARSLGLEIPANPESRALIAATLASPGPVAFDPASGLTPPATVRERLGVQSLLCMAVYPKASKPYVFVLHQCTDARIWSDDDKRLFQAIGQRVADGLASLIAYRDLRGREGQLRTLVQTIPDVVWLKDLNDVYLSCNTQFERLAGLCEHHIVGRTTHDILSKELADVFRQNGRGAIDKGEACAFETRLTFAADGYQGLFDVVKTPVRDEAGRTIGVLGIARDITERSKAEDTLRLAATAFEAQEGILIADANHSILRVNRAYAELTGYEPEDLIGKTPESLRPDDLDPALYQAAWERANQEGTWRGEASIRRKNGATFPAWVNVTAVRSSRGDIAHYVATLVDITERKAAEKKIEHLAFYDPLTQLPNRRLFVDRLQQALAGCGRSGRKGALLFIDLDNFKLLNETSGHDVGDLLLIEVAQRLGACVGAGDTVARLGGDEFVVLLEDLNENAREAGAQAESVADRVLSDLGRPYAIAGRQHHSTPSIGVSVFIDGNDSLDELLKQADIALYQAKSAGRNALRFFDPQMQDSLAARSSLESALRLAILEGQFVLYYQPQVEDAGGVIGAEALVRWRHPERGIVLPGEFIPVAEETGLILPLGQWVLEAACSRLKLWAADPRASALHLAINVSARQFRQPDFVERVRGALARSGAPAEKLKLELTESLIIDDVEGTIEKMKALKQLGVGFAMDDFGTGYSSLSYLTRLPLDQIKIDRSFVRNLPDSANDAAVAQTIVTLAASLGLAVVAEGVETEAQQRFLRGLGCPTSQGFLFSPPVDIADFQRLLA